MVIRDVTPNVVTLSVPFARFGKVPIGGRATIVRLTSGALAIFSPVALTLTVRAKLSSLGNNVRYLIAPDIEHHLFLSEWKSAFPDAKLIGPEGLPEKRAKAHAAGSEMIGNEEFDAVVTRENYLNVLGEFGEDFATDFDMEYVSAHPNRELVFYFRPDRVLIQADLFFNLPATEQYSRVPESEKPSPGLLTRMFTSLQTPGSGNPLGMKRFMWYLVSNSRGDREAFNESVRRIGEWDFEVVVPCHGETVVQGGKELFERVFEWHLKAAREKGKF